MIQRVAVNVQAIIKKPYAARWVEIGTFDIHGRDSSNSREHPRVFEQTLRGVTKYRPEVFIL